VESETKPGAERRIGVRSEAHFEVRYGVGSDLVSGESFDLGPGGIGLIGPKHYPVGSELDIHFRAPASEQDLMKMKAVVRHSTGRRMGLQFVNVRASEHAKIMQTIELLVGQQRGAGEKKK